MDSKKSFNSILKKVIIRRIHSEECSKLAVNGGECNALNAPFMRMVHFLASKISREAVLAETVKNVVTGLVSLFQG